MGIVSYQQHILSCLKLRELRPRLRFISALFAVTFSLLWVVTTKAGLVYVDATDGVYAATPSTANTYNATNDSTTDWVTNVDNTPQWRFRNSGPGAVSYGTSAYDGRPAEGDGVIYTKLTGLVPYTNYTGVRLYFVVSADNSLWDLQYSFDGMNWSDTIDRDTPGVVFLADSTSDALGTEEVGTPASDTRCYLPIATPLTTDTNGEARVYFQTVAGANRGVIDGLAYEGGSGSVTNDPGTELTPMEKLATYNQVWTVKGTNSADSMPLGNGDESLNVWVEDNGDLLFYLGKNDSWSEATRLLKLGRVRVHLTPNPFATGAPFEETLDLHNSEIVINAGTNGQSMTLRVWVDANHPVARVECTGEQPFTMQVSLETWRNSTIAMNSGTQDSYYGVRSGPVTPTEAADVVLSRTNRVVWYHRNESSFYQATLDNQHLSGFEATYPDPYMHLTFGGRIDGPGLTNVDDMTLETPLAVTNAQFCVHALTEQTAAVDDWEATLNAVAETNNAMDWETARTEHRVWWDGFWNRSWIFISGDSSATRLTEAWLLQRYLTACQSRGQYPVKFNGGTFTFDYGGQNADYRKWGAPFWHQNTRLSYWSLLGSGDADLMTPFFNMYMNALPLQRAVTTNYFGHGGAFFPETMYFFGLYNNDNFGWGTSGNYTANNYIKYHWQSGLEVLANMLDYYDYEEDDAFVTNTLVPFATEVVRFYDQHWSRINGVIEFYPVNGMETYWSCTNSTDVIAGLRSDLPRLLALATNLTTQVLRDEWQNCLDDMPPLPVGMSVNNNPCVLPAEIYAGTHNSENVALHAVFPYRLYGRGRTNLAYAVESYTTRPFKVDGTSWHYDAIDAAALGLASEAKARIVAKLNSVRGAVRFPAFWRPGDQMPDQQGGGVVVIALQDMLLQRNGDDALLLPAWPSGWDVDFKLLAPGRKAVRCKLTNGVIEELNVTKNGTNLYVAGGQTLSLPFSVINYGPGTSSTGEVTTATSGVESTGDLVNDGTMRLTGDATLDVSGDFTNNGILDVITWSGTLPAGLVNNGTILDRSDVTISASHSGGMVHLNVPGFAGHAYQLQSSGTLEPEVWGDVGSPVAGTGGTIDFPVTPFTNEFFRVKIQP